MGRSRSASRAVSGLSEGEGASRRRGASVAGRAQSAVCGFKAGNGIAITSGSHSFKNALGFGVTADVVVAPGAQGEQVIALGSKAGTGIERVQRAAIVPDLIGAGRLLGEDRDFQLDHLTVGNRRGGSGNGCFIGQT